MDWYSKLKGRLAPLSGVKIEDEHAVVSSVIIPIGWNRETSRDEILMTKRTGTVQTHKHQVGFPGGVYDLADSGNVLKTAVRELEEEIGVPESKIEILGRLQVVKTIGNVVIYPFVAKMDFPFDYKLNEHEVARLIPVPLVTLLEEGLKPVEVSVDWFNVKSVGITVENELIWGASAKMLEELIELLVS